MINTADIAAWRAAFSTVPRGQKIDAANAAMAVAMGYCWPKSGTVMNDAKHPTTIGAGLQRAMRDALIDVISGMKNVTDADALDVIMRLRKVGAEVVYTSQVEQWGEMADCCIYRETGKQCSFCKCDRRNMA